MSAVMTTQRRARFNRIRSRRRNRMAATTRRAVSEILEPRIVLDGGMLGSDPDILPADGPMPDLVAREDSYEFLMSPESRQLTVLDNDLAEPPEQQLTIVDLSESQRGSTIEIAADGQSILYTPALPEVGDDFEDRFFYTVESDEGVSSSASVSVVMHPLVRTHPDHFETKLGERVVIHVLENDEVHDSVEQARVIGVDVLEGHGTVEVTDDGLAVVFLAEPNADGGPDFPIVLQYIVEADGTRAVGDVMGHVIDEPPVRVWPANFRVETGSGPIELDVFKDSEVTPGTRITDVSESRTGNKIWVAEDGKSVWFQPRQGFRGNDNFLFSYTDELGRIYPRVSVLVSVTQRFVATPDHFWNIPDTVEGFKLDVLANDRRLFELDEAKILEVSQPELGSARTDGEFVYYSGQRGEIGQTRFQYRVEGPTGKIYHTSVHLSVVDSLIALDDYLAVEPGSGTVRVLPLHNDYVDGQLITDFFLREHGLPEDLQITEVSLSDAGGSVAIAEGGQHLLFAPNAGFSGALQIHYVAQHGSATDDGVITVEVAPQVTDEAGNPVFSSLELEHQVLHAAVTSRISQLGVHFKAGPSIEPIYFDGFWRVDATAGPIDVAFDGGSGGGAEGPIDFSKTNVQVAGVDEADLVKTDGNYIYEATGSEVAIVDVSDPDVMKVVARIEMRGHSRSIYVVDDRLIVLQNAPVTIAFDAIRPQDTQQSISVFDISDRTQPRLVSDVTVGGSFQGSRLVGGRLYLLSNQWLNLPTIASTCDDDGNCRYEDHDEFVTRLKDDGWVDLSLPSISTRAAGSDDYVTTRSNSIYKAPESTNFRSFATVSVIDVIADDPQVLGMASVDTLGGYAVTYVTADSFYVLQQLYENGETWTRIQQFGIAPETGDVQFLASGRVAGTVLNQFSADEYDGHLRVATTVNRGRESSNELYVLKRDGNQLDVVGHVGGLAKGERIFSARFMGDRAYLVTFRLIDPLFSIDLSDPTNPVVGGELKIPGFSNYLHPVGENHLIGIGRDADPITGRANQPQVSLFDVSDLSAPRQVDVDFFIALDWGSSAALWDHHAFSFFDEFGVLALPVQGVRPTERVDGEVWQPREQVNLLSVLNIDPDAENPEDAITVRGEVPQRTTVERSLRIEETLFAVGLQEVTAVNLLDVEEIFGSVYVGQIAVDDHADVAQQADQLVINVLENDYRGGDGVTLKLISVGESQAGAEVTIGDDGAVIYRPADGFSGRDVLTYTVEHSQHGVDQGRIFVNVHRPPDAMDDQYTIRPDSGEVWLSVLDNDIGENNFIARPWLDVAFGDFWRPWNPLTIGSVTPAENGRVAIEDGARRLIYTPNEGFEGTDEFQYTAVDHWGGWDTATVKVYVSEEGTVTVFDVKVNDGNPLDQGLETVAVQFTGDMSDRLRSTTMQLTDTSTGSAIDLSGASLEWDGASNTARWDLSQLSVPSGHYQVEFGADDFVVPLDGDGDGTAGDNFVTSFGQRPGDLDGDLDIDSADLLVFLGNWTGSLDEPNPEINFSHGDLDGDGDVDSVDLLRFLERWTGADPDSSVAPPPVASVDQVFGESEDATDDTMLLGLIEI